MNKNVLFFANQLSCRGTEVALFDYAKHNKRLGNISAIVTYRNKNHEAMSKFHDEFGKVILIDEQSEITKLSTHFDVVYRICEGRNENLKVNCKLSVHAVFGFFDPFGDAYAYVSEWLRNSTVPQHLQTKYDYVPHMIDLPKINDNLRDNLNIPENAVVFGYHGGADSFNIEFVKRAIIQARSDVYFVFMNIPQFSDNKNIRFLAGNTDLVYKTKFINTCDFMIHARERGETFGLSVGEFSTMNKRIITYMNSPERCHIDILKDKAIYYNNYNTVLNIINNVKKEDGNYDCYSSQFSPSVVMKKFEKVFL